jgi:hypothetical protein
LLGFLKELELILNFSDVFFSSISIFLPLNGVNMLRLLQFISQHFLRLADKATSAIYEQFSEAQAENIHTALTCVPVTESVHEAEN